LDHFLLVKGSLSLAGGGSLEAPIAHGFHGQLAFQPAFTTELTKKNKTVYPLALDMGLSPVYRLLKTESLLTIKLFFFFFFSFFFYGQLYPQQIS